MRTYLSYPPPTMSLCNFDDPQARLKKGSVCDLECIIFVCGIQLVHLRHSQSIEALVSSMLEGAIVSMPISLLLTLLKALTLALHYLCCR